MVIAEQGGIYFDTDVELIRPIDGLLTNPAFFGFEDSEHVATGLGFGAEKVDAQAFDSELTIKDIVGFGMIPELASRMNRIVNLRPLNHDDYIYLICDFDNSPIRRLEEKYGYEAGFIKKNILSEEKLMDIAVEAYESGLGVRAAYSAIQRAIDNYVFDNFNSLCDSYF